MRDWRPRRALALRRAPHRDRMWVVWAHPLLSPDLPPTLRALRRRVARPGALPRARHGPSPVRRTEDDAAQLGGEFVLGPGLSCTYAHRMQSTAGHAPIVDVLAAAGVRPTRKHAGGPVAPASSASMMMQSAGVGTLSVRPNISLPLERGREAKVLSVVREEACGSCGTCEGCAEALNIDLESTASGEWSMVVTGNTRSMR
ncbi:hypothetical protein EDB89DRAFT_1648591 [Lactarius sanguifluus]|nr:hypothetical protein EDB89DRAFT_1648591 [Lactarius sanguifluus]